MRALITTALGSLIRIAGVEHMRQTLERYLMALMFGIMAMFAGIAAIAYALGALWFFVLPMVGAVYAYLIVAGVLALLTLILALAARSATRRRAVKPPPVPVGGGGFQTNGITGLASAAIAGLIVGLVRGPK